jgi:four helix bundle protein
MKENIINIKTETFAVRIVNLYKHLHNKKSEFVLSKQILRSGTSIGANISEAQCAASKKDWVAKLQIAYKECSETKYWLRLLNNTGYISDEEFKSIYSECDEVIRILSALIKTTRLQEDYLKNY